MTAPSFAADPGVAGGHTALLDDVYRAGMDPVAAFGGAFGLNRVVGHDRVNQFLNSVAGNPPAATTAPPEPPAPAPPGGPGPRPGESPQTTPQTSLDGSAGSPMDGPTAQVPKPAPSGGPKPSPDAAPEPPKAPGPAPGEPTVPKGPVGAAGDIADDAGHVAVKAAQRTLREAIVDRGIKKGLAEASALAARRGALMGAKLGAQTALRLGTMSLPGLGLAITAAFWVFDTDERRAVNNLISELFGPGGAPDLNARPEPPRTYFLPLTHDGNRDGTIVRMDQGMVRTNNAAFEFHPEDVWPTVSPAIETTTNFSAVAAKVNALAGKVDGLIQSIQAAYKTPTEEPYVAATWAKAKPSVTALEELRDTVLPAMGRQLMGGATNFNDAYQAFRQVNLTNRQEINNSTSGLIPFMANHVNEANMSDSTANLKNAVEEMNRTAQALAGAADPFTIADYHGSGTPAQSTTDTGATKPQPEPAPAAPPPAAPPAAPPASNNPDQQAKDLASLLRSGLPTMPGMGMPTMPSMPTMPGLGNIPGLANAAHPGQNPLAHPGVTDADLKKALDDRLKEKPASEHAPTKPGDGPATGVAADPGAAMTPAGHKTPGPAHPPGPGAPGTPGGPPGAANTTEIGGRKWTFDNPKLAALAHNLAGTDGSSHKSIRQAASEAGFRLPPPGQDIGTPVGSSDLKPGNVIMGANNQNAVYLGEQGGKDWAITEQGEVKPLDEVTTGGGPHEGLFRLVDDGAATPGAEAQTIQQTSAQAPPPAAPVTTQDTHTGVIPQQGPPPGRPGLDPGAVPPGN
ncbi:hypothetical protein BST19_21390 [Mycobacterium bouchedurhonense]|uniref:Peptidoglycan-binding protein n=2 Tax=Mycobacterium avium complex (MAC) TaxID=120793 RepID=A0ABX3S9R7_MYCBC|nr:hypothetical protein BST19_21390 [Mycobacterium bouchedurhonense]